MARKKGNTDIEDMMEWLNRLDLSSEELGLAANDREWQDFIASKLESKGIPGAGGYLQAFMDWQRSIANEVDFRSVMTTLSGGGVRWLFQDINTGRFISREQAMTRASLVRDLFRGYR